jgi:hypothetical protein
VGGLEFCEQGNFLFRAALDWLKVKIESEANKKKYKEKSSGDFLPVIIAYQNYTIG